MSGNTHWNVPRAPNPLFTGRQDLLGSMKNHLVTAPEKKDRPVFVLQGIGGAGKSEAAIKFATEYQDSFWGIFWVDADNRQSIEQGFAEIARMQDPPLEDIAPKDVIRWLATTKESWLLILDNCDDAEIDFARYMPSRGGSVILTTRLKECRTLGTWENIDELGPEDAKQLLLKASGLENGDLTALIPAAGSVVSVLGQHALALVHAGAYIKKGYCNLSDYVQFFRDEHNRLMEFKPKQHASRYGSVYTTFEISARALAMSDRHDSHLALKLLNILGFLDRDAVEEDVFAQAFDECYKLEDDCGYVWEENEVQWFQHCAVTSTEHGFDTKHHDGPGSLDSLGYTKDVSCSWMGDYRLSCESEVQDDELLETWSAVQPMAHHGGKSYESTDLTSGQNIISDTINDPTVSDHADFPVVDHSSAVSNAEHELPRSGNHDSNKNDEAAEDSEDFAYYEHDDEVNHLDLWHCEKVRSSGLVERQKTTRLRAACVRLADLSLIKYDDNTISTHPLVHDWTRNRLGELARQNAWEQALSILTLCSYDDMVETTCHVKVVPHMESCLVNRGDDSVQRKLSLSVVRALHHLALVFKLHGKVETSLAILETISVSYEVQPHTRSFKTKILLHLKASCLGSVGRLDEMQSCVDQIVQSTTRYFEPDSREAYTCHMLVADTLHIAGNFEDEVDLRQSLYERNSRTSILDTSGKIALLESLSQAYQSHGNNERAMALLVEALEISEHAYPLHHPKLLYNSQLLAELYITTGEAGKAVTVLENAVKPGYERLKRDHSWLYIMSTLARAYEELSKYDQAISVHEQLHLYNPKIQSVDIRIPVAAMRRLACAYICDGKPSQAVPLLEEVVEKSASNLVLLDDPQRFITMHCLAVVYLGLDRPSQAVGLLEKVIECIPEHDPGRLLNMQSLARAYLNLDKPSQAVPLLEKVADIMASSLAPDDPERLLNMQSLVWAYSHLDKLNQAVPLLEKVVSIMTSSRAPDDPERLLYMKRLAWAWTDLGKPDQAVTLLEEVIKCVPEHDPGRLISMDRLAEAYLDLDKPGQAVTLLEAVVALEASSLPLDDLDRLLSMDRLADAYIRLDKPIQAIPLLEEVVAMEAQLLEEEDESRLFSLRRLAQAYNALETSEKVNVAISILEEVMDKGRETLHADPEELSFTQELLASAQDKLRQTSRQQPSDDSGKEQQSLDDLGEEQQSLVNLEEVRGILNATADTLPNSTVYQQLRNFTKSAALMF